MWILWLVYHNCLSTILVLWGVCVLTSLGKITMWFSSTIVPLYFPFCHTLREEPSQIDVILQQKQSTEKLRAVCTVYKMWLATYGCNCGLRTTINTQDTIPCLLLLLLLLNHYQYNYSNTISYVSVVGQNNELTIQTIQFHIKAIFWKRPISIIKSIYWAMESSQLSSHID